MVSPPDPDNCLQQVQILLLPRAQLSDAKDFKTIFRKVRLALRHHSFWRISGTTAKPFPYFRPQTHRLRGFAGLPPDYSPFLIVLSSGPRQYEELREKQVFGGVIYESEFFPDVPEECQPAECYIQQQVLNCKKSDEAQELDHENSAEFQKCIAFKFKLNRMSIRDSRNPGGVREPRTADAQWRVRGGLRGSRFRDI